MKSEAVFGGVEGREWCSDERAEMSGEVNEAHDGIADQPLSREQLRSADLGEVPLVEQRQLQGAVLRRQRSPARAGN